MRSILIFAELLGVLLYYNILSGKQIFYKFFICIVLAASTTGVFLFLNKIINFTSVISLVLSCVIMSLIIKILEKKEMYPVIVKILISFLLVAVNEIITGALMQVVLGDREYISEIYIIIGLVIIMAISIYCLNIKLKKKKLDFTKMVSRYKSLNIIIINLIIYCMIAKIFLTNGYIKPEVIIKIAFLGVLLLVINVYFYLYLHKTLNQKKKTEIKKSFNPLISELMLKLKSNENDYNNHLKEIYNIVNSEENQFEANEKVKKYIKDVAVDDKNFVKLLEIKNTIIKAVLYNKMQRAQKLGISCEYTVNSDFKYIPVDDSELTVILSNVINNAIEATSLIKKKEMNINIYENDKKYIIEVVNRIEGVKNKDLKQMFKYGYSTKGEGRGYGLYNVKNIVDRNRGKISTNIKEDIFTMEIKFNKDA